MSLDVVNNAENSGVALQNRAIAPLTVFSKWQDFPISRISHHGGLCCEASREWLTAMDYSQLNAGSKLSGPRWIPQRYSWGPTKWPIHWCEALDQKSLDCGAQSALSLEIFKARGVRSFQVQLVQEFSNETTRQWAEKWSKDETSTFWIDKNLIYHECCAILTGENTLKLWDGSAGCWINSKQFQGYGTLRALRLIDKSGTTTSFKWGDHTIHANNWQEIN